MASPSSAEAVCTQCGCNFHIPPMASEPMVENPDRRCSACTPFVIGTSGLGALTPEELRLAQLRAATTVAPPQIRRQNAVCSTCFQTDCTCPPLGMPIGTSASSRTVEEDLAYLREPIPLRRQNAVCSTCRETDCVCPSLGMPIGTSAASASTTTTKK